jgi:hypothetical protein
MNEDNKGESSEGISISTNTEANVGETTVTGITAKVSVNKSTNSKPLKKGKRDIIKIDCKYCKVGKIAERVNKVKVKCLKCHGVFGA